MSDLQSFLQYLLAIELLALAVWPLSRRLFNSFPDQGWGMSKALGLLLATWLVWMLGSLGLAPFTVATVTTVVIIIALASWVTFLIKDNKRDRGDRGKVEIRVILVEEVLFITAFGFWTYVRGFSPDIHGLEKFMDYGFMLSILRGRYFPPLDHFLAGETINYYYFGHLMAAFLGRLAQVPANIAYNLQIALLYGLTVLGSFSLGLTLFAPNEEKVAKRNRGVKKIGWKSYLAGALAALFVTSIGNLHALANIRNLSSYWYPTATRLIPNTINEFPFYSWVVADLHGHVSNLPIVLLIIGLLSSYIFSCKRDASSREQKEKRKKKKYREKIKNFLNFDLQFLTFNFEFLTLLLLALATGAAFATNAWDYPIYLALVGLLLLVVNWRRSRRLAEAVGETVKIIIPVLLASIVLFLPYWLTVKPNTSGIGLVAFVDSFNPKDFAQLQGLPLPLYIFKRFVIRSPLNLLFQLWGFYAVLATGFVVWLFRSRLDNLAGRAWIVMLVAKTLGVGVSIKKREKNWGAGFLSKIQSLAETDFISLIFIAYAFLLILLPEWIYINDIYKPDYYRANTLFKFYYQAWVLLALATSYGTVRIFAWTRQTKNWLGRIFLLAFFAVLLPSVLLYTRLALDSSTGGAIKTRKTLDGAAWLTTSLPTDAGAIGWLNQNIRGQPFIAEAVGDSYTDYSRISANTGLPTVIGWPVHEWLWRGSYSDPIRPASKLQKRSGEPDSVAQRVADVQQIYESTDLELTQELLNKYKVSFIYVGGLEKEKYPNLNANKFSQLGEVVYERQGVKIFKLPNAF